MKLVYRYVFSNVLKSFTAILLVLSAVAMIAEWMRFGNIISIKDLDILILSLVPVATFAIPMSVVFSVLLVMDRLSSDSEIIAMKASGIRWHSIYTPVLAFSTACMVVHLAISTYLGPMAMARLQQDIMNEARQKIYAFIEERDFLTMFKGLIVYVDAVDRSSHELKGIFIQTVGKHPSIITAEMGYIDLGLSRLTLTLKQGSIFTKSKDIFRYATFDEYMFSIKANLSRELSFRPYDSATQPQLKQMINKSPNKDWIKEYHGRLALPVLNLILGMIGITFGYQGPARETKRRGFLIGIGTIVAYYMVFVLSSRLAKSGAIGPVAGAWLPDVIFGLVLAILWIWRSKR